MKKLSLFTALAAILSFSSCEDDPILGCTDSTAINYDALATEDDGLCLYNVSGCTDTLALNYDVLATLDDGSCEYPLFGCMDPLATNYDELADTDDESCLYFEDLIIGTWNGVDATFMAELSNPMITMIQMMNPEEFEMEFDTTMPTTTEDWDYFFETNFGETESMDGTTLEFDGSNFILTEEGDTESFTYNFTSLTSFNVDATASIGVSYFDVLVCTETNLTLFSEVFNPEENLTYTIKINFIK